MRTFHWLILCAAALQALALQARAQLFNGMLAVVHESVITYNEERLLDEQTTELLRREYFNQPELYRQKVEETRRENLNTLINRQLVLHEFQTAGYSLPDSVLDELLQDEIRERYGDRQRALQTLAAEGVTLDTYRQRVRDDFILVQLRAKNVSQGIIVSPHKVETYYKEHQNDPQFLVEDQVKLNLIVLPKSADTNAVRAHQMADEIVVRLKDGASFEDLARTYSQGAAPAQTNDWVGRNYYVKPVSDVAFKLKPGDTSEVIDTPEACYLVHVQDIQAAHVKPLSEVRDQIEASLLAQEQKRLTEQWYQRLRKKTFVVTY